MLVFAAESERREGGRRTKGADKSGLQQKRRIVALNKADIRYTAASEVRLLYEMEFENGISN